MDKNKTSIKKEIEEQKSSVKTINFSTQIEKNKNSKVEKMEICPHCGFVFENDKNYWLINRTELLVEQNKKAKEEAERKEREAKEVENQEKIKTPQEIGLELQKLHSDLIFLIDKKSNNN